MEGSWPLTGRDAELRRITDALRPGAAGILVAGAAGVGKTRLAREAVARVEHGVRLVWVYGSTAAGEYPLGAFAGVVDAPTADATRGVAMVLDSLVRQGPLVLAVDDAHLLDELSAIVLHRVVTRRLAAVVVTVRDGVPAPDTVTALWKEDHLPRLDLAPLDAEATAALVAQVLRGPVESASARRLWSLTRGSPLFLRHLLVGEVQSGRFSPSSGMWCWSGNPELSPRLATLLDRDIGNLDAALLEVVDLVALAEPVAVSTLVELTSAGAVEVAEMRGLIRTDPSSDSLAARPAHPLYGEVRRAAIGRARARRLRGLVAATLDGATDPIPKAVLMVDSDLDPDPDLYLRAAQAAIGFYDLPLAERLARAAATFGGWDARVAHASTLSWLSRGDEAEELLCELADTAHSGVLRAQARAYRTGNLLWTLGRADQARETLTAALADTDAGPARLLLEALAAALDASLGDAPSALTRGLALLDAGVPDDLALLLTASAVSAAAAVTGRLDLLARAGRAGGAAQLPNTIPRFGLTDWQVLGFRLAGDPESARRVAADMHAMSADLPGPARLMGLVLVAHASLANGRVQDALTPLREAWAGLEASGHEFRFRCRTLLATALALTGRADAARPLLEEATSRQHPAYRLYRPDDQLARAWGTAADGAVTEAARLAAAAAATARRQMSPAYEVLAWQTAVQLGDASDAVGRLEVLAEVVAGPRASAALAHARALAAQDANGLVAAAQVWERLGDLVAGGDAAAQAADVHRRQGRHGSALSAAARARRLSQTSGARTPALATAELPLPLTSREREIAALVAKGMTNREVAERLTVSIRTVEGHLYRVGHKLGLSDRADLADIFGRDGSE